jgi:hypothetical protein
MIQTIFGEIKGFLDKDFLLGSLLPSLVFIASIGGTLGGVFGLNGTLAWLDTWTSTQGTVVTFVGFVGVIVCAYIVYSLRLPFLKLWSGSIKGPLSPLVALGEHCNRRRYQADCESAHRVPEWQDVLDGLARELQRHWKTTGSEISVAGLEAIKKAMSERTTEDKSTASLTKSWLQDKIVPHFKECKWDERLNAIYNEIKGDLDYRAREEQAEINNRRFHLDRQFGPAVSIRATALGNVVESYNAYPYRRYMIEGEVFWPHLQQVINKDFMGRIKELRIILDFYLTMASLGVLYALLAALGGPWLWLNLQFWLLLAVIAVVMSYTVYYRLAVTAATQYGDMIRAGYDLYRKDLLKEFLKVVEGIPKSYRDEIKEWENLSRLLVHGQPPTEAKPGIAIQPQTRTVESQGSMLGGVHGFGGAIKNFFGTPKA